MGLENGDSAAFFSAAAEGRLVFQKCTACGEVQYPPRYHCAKCWKTELDWIESSGRGRVETFTIVRRAPLAAFRERVPYVVAAIDVEEGPRMITNLVGDDALEVGIGDPVEVVFADGEGSERLVMFRRR